MMRLPALLLLLTPLVACAAPTPHAGIDSRVLLRTTQAWDGSPYTRYPDGQPELTLLKIRIPAHTTLDWHRHPIPNAGYLISGELLVEKPGGGQSLRLKAGDALAEIVDGVHRGKTGSQPAELMVFYAGSEGMPLSQAADSREQFQEPGTEALVSLLDGIEQRLDLAEAVALNKWDKGQPVQATARERQVIVNARTRAAQFGLSEQRADGFFDDQIEANKLLQYSVLARWLADGGAPPIPRMHLATQIRPRLDALQDELLEKLAALDRERPVHCARMTSRLIEQRKLSPQRNLALIRASAHLCNA
ncbi:gamma subclass chorismate mutase AroQ [Pseudomonas huaxiensis]|uniref:gamma subclass chorismate mutase AroQ n=1 Tax=Pseudomonas huaxiensis TaxID=2213017 RepID=UPI001CDC1FD9|nr:gamma subclass chorismate mutase AroQ [Pseudomonas huaxiensis]